MLGTLVAVSLLAACASEKLVRTVDDGGTDAGLVDDAGPGQETMPGCYKYPDDGTCAAPLLHTVCFMANGPACDTDGALYPNGAIGYCCP